MGKQSLFAFIVVLMLTGLCHAAPDSAVVDKQTGFSMDQLRRELQADDTVPVAAKTDAKPYKASGSREAVMLTLKLMFYVAVIGTLLYFILKIIKKNMHRGSGLLRNGSRSIEVLEAAPLGPRKSIQLVRVAGRVLALGVTEESVRTLAEFTDRESVDTILKNNRETATKVADNFSSSINHFLSKFRKQGPRTVSSMTHDPDLE